MKTTFKLIVSIFILTSFSCLAQEINIEDFTIQSNDFYYDDESMEVSSVFSKTGNTITWTQNKGGSTLVTELTILNTTGSWNSDTSTGQITMTILVAGNSKTLTLSEDNGNLTLTIVTTIQNNISEELDFEITSITYQ